MLLAAFQTTCMPPHTRNAAVPEMSFEAWPEHFIAEHYDVQVHRTCDIQNYILHHFILLDICVKILMYLSHDLLSNGHKYFL